MGFFESDEFQYLPLNLQKCHPAIYCKSSLFLLECLSHESWPPGAEPGAWVQSQCGVPREVLSVSSALGSWNRLHFASVPSLECWTSILYPAECCVRCGDGEADLAGFSQVPFSLSALVSSFMK